MPTDEATTILKRDVLGRVTFTKEQREALLDEFERSGLKGKPFAKLVGVNYQSFASWIQKRRRARGDYVAMAAAKRV
jgi:transposase